MPSSQGPLLKFALVLSLQRCVALVYYTHSKYAKSPIKAFPQSVAKPTPIMESQHTQLISRDGTGPGIRTHFSVSISFTMGPLYTRNINSHTHSLWGPFLGAPVIRSPRTCECGNNNYVWGQIYCALHYSLLHYSIRI